tara:strand:- start:21 stop:743 length:723 start_codon:yes stop_codon:yes gene_type:complete
MFWKKKNNKIIFWSGLKGLPDIVPIRESKHFIPEWFKKAPSFRSGENELTSMPTVKRCPGFIDFFKMGYVLPAWCDFHLEVAEDVAEDGFKVETPQNAFPADYHGPSQFIDYLPEHAKENVKLAFKPGCPWRVKTPKGIKMLELPMLHHYNPDFYTVGGLIDTHLFHEMNPIWLFTRTGEFFIKRGTPLSMFIPIRTEEFDVVIREQTKEDDDAFGKQVYAITSVFNSKMRKYEKIEECP